jgi:DUF4097 and DUF4098 domain-containing protein YvlB
MILFYFFIKLAWSQLSDQPRITTNAGNILFETGSNKNIEFKTSSGKVFINGQDFQSLQTQVDGHSQ